MRNAVRCALPLAFARGAATSLLTLQQRGGAVPGCFACSVRGLNSGLALHGGGRRATHRGGGRVYYGHDLPGGKHRAAAAAPLARQRRRRSSSHHGPFRIASSSASDGAHAVSPLTNLWQSSGLVEEGEGAEKASLVWRDDLSTAMPLHVSPANDDGGGGGGVDVDHDGDASQSNLLAAGEKSSKDVSILSWNILAQAFAEKDFALLEDYPGKKPLSALEAWDCRARKIIAEIKMADADVVCLQEVSPDSFGTDLRPAMAEAGYDGIAQDNKRAEHLVATFWKSARFVLDATSSRSRTMTTVLRDSRNLSHLLAVVNCHLEGHPLKSVARVTQLSHTLNEVKAKFSHHGLVVCGDFNCELHSSACGAFLALGSCPEDGVKEWGRAVPVEVASIAPHDYDLASAYPPELGMTDKFSYYTYSRLPGRPVAGLDQIWHTPGPLRRVALRKLFRSDGRRRAMLETGLPNSIHPSDHVPIGCVLRWTFESDDNDSLSSSAGGKQQRRRRLLDLREPVDELEHTNDSMTSGEMLDEAERLLEQSVPSFAADDDRRREFEYVISEVSDMPMKGRKPTEEQLVQLTDRRKRREKLLAEVTEKERKVLKRILKLRREAAHRSRHLEFKSGKN